MQFSVLSHLQRLRGLGGILDQPEGVKSRLGFSRSGVPQWKVIELQEDVLAPSTEQWAEADSVDEDLQCRLAVIRSEEL